MALSPDPHLVLRPGVVVLPREPGIVQVGLDAPRRALLPDRPDVRRLLDALSTGGPVPTTTADTASALTELERAELLVDVGPHGPRGAASCAALARHGRGGAERAASRAAARVLVDASPALRGEVVRLLGDAGLASANGPGDATVVLVVGDREVSRSRLDPWIRDGVPHLLVQARDGGLCVGPFVVPGVTACARCVDAHLGEQDTRRPIMVELLARRPEPAVRDPLVTTLALAWAVHDLTCFVEGERPGSWSATIDVGTADSGPVPTPVTWSRHPVCGCAWDDWTSRLRDLD